jgi:hypothetical protein
MRQPQVIDSTSQDNTSKYNKTTRPPELTTTACRVQQKLLEGARDS